MSKNCTNHIIRYDDDSYYNIDGDKIIPTIRTKWEVVETPLVFNDSVFSKFL